MIELDGAQHGEVTARAYAEKRTAFLNRRGYRVLRFSNREVFRIRDQVVDAIARFAEAFPYLNHTSRGSTSPQRGGDS